MELKGKISLYKDGKKTILVIDDDSINMEQLVSTILCRICNEEIHTTEISDLSPVVESDETPVINPDAEYTPDFLTSEITDPESETETEQVVENDDCGNHIVTMNGKYKSSGMTIQEIWDKDSGWLKWVAEKSVSKHGDVERIKAFLATKN